MKMSSKDFEVKKLKGHDNYHTWSFSVRNFIDYKGYGNCLKVVETVVNDVKVSSCKEKDETKLIACRALLALSVDENIQTHIAACTTAIEIWNVLKKTLREHRTLT